MHQSMLIRHNWNRINKQNKNWLVIICGETGSGKSYSALRIAEMLDKDFSVERVVFSITEFMTLLNSGKLKRGNVIIFDEAGVGIASREWYSARNKMINYVLQTFRHLNLAVIFTTPDFGFVDTQTRKLFHSYIETQRINKEKKAVRVKWFELQKNPRYGKMYFKYPRIRKSGGTFHKINKVYIKKPSRGLVNAYERKRTRFSLNLREEIEKDIKEIKSRGRGSGKTDEQYISIIADKLKGEKVTITAIQAVTGLSYKKAGRLRTIIRLKTPPPQDVI